jgi:hypothetical protein
MSTEQSKFAGLAHLWGRIFSLIAGRADICAGRKSDSHSHGNITEEGLNYFPEYQGVPKSKGNLQALNWLKKQTRRI